MSNVNQITGGPVANAAFFMYVCKSPYQVDYVTQTYYEWNGDVYYRRLDNNTWSEWTMISVQKFLRPYTDLNGLASALGVNDRVEMKTSSYSPHPRQDAIFKYDLNGIYLDLCISNDGHILYRNSSQDEFTQII